MTSAQFDTLDLEQVLYIHERIIKASGGTSGIRDLALLHSALERCKATFAGEDVYPSLFEKTAALFHSLVMNHAFVDGNKRTAFAIMMRFLNYNDCQIMASQAEIVRMCLAVDTEGWQVSEVVAWLKQYCQME